jgi:hypothetical protein
VLVYEKVSESQYTATSAHSKESRIESATESVSHIDRDGAGPAPPILSSEMRGPQNTETSECYSNFSNAERPQEGVIIKEITEFQATLDNDIPTLLVEGSRNEDALDVKDESKLQRRILETVSVIEEPEREDKELKLKKKQEKKKTAQKLSEQVKIIHFELLKSLSIFLSL